MLALYWMLSSLHWTNDLKTNDACQQLKDIFAVLNMKGR